MPVTRSASSADLKAPKKCRRAVANADDKPDVVARRTERAERLGFLSWLPRDVIEMIKPMLGFSEAPQMRMLGSPFIEYTQTDEFRAQLDRVYTADSLPNAFALARAMAMSMSSAERKEAAMHWRKTLSDRVSERDRKALLTAAFCPEHTNAIAKHCGDYVRIACALAADAYEDTMEFTAQTVVYIAARYKLFDKIVVYLRMRPYVTTSVDALGEVPGGAAPGSEAAMRLIIERLDGSMIHACSLLMNQKYPRHLFNYFVAAHSARLGPNVLGYTTGSYSSARVLHVLRKGTAPFTKEEVAACLWNFRGSKAAVIDALEALSFDAGHLCRQYASYNQFHKAGKYLALVESKADAERVLDGVACDEKTIEAVLVEIAKHPVFVAALPESHLLDNAVVNLRPMKIEVYRQMLRLGAVFRRPGAALLNAVKAQSIDVCRALVREHPQITDEMCASVIFEAAKNRLPPVLHVILESGRVSEKEVIRQIAVACSSWNNSLLSIAVYYQ